MNPSDPWMNPFDPWPHVINMTPNPTRTPSAVLHDLNISHVFYEVSLLRDEDRQLLRISNSRFLCFEITPDRAPELRQHPEVQSVVP